MTAATPPDAQARLHAVDVTRSVIVQAPAGSGKTTLLVERILGLLAIVDAPEEILAVTFTRKAASQMRQRVLEFLAMPAAPQSAHEQSAWHKAHAVADKVAAWGLLENPSRLKIMTLDSFNAQLVRQMPVLSRLGPVPGLTENAALHYRQAAQRTLDTLNDDVRTLLLWRDGNLSETAALIASLLPARERWLRVLGARGAPSRASLEQALNELIDDELQQTRVVLDQALAKTGCALDELWDLARFGASHRPEHRRAGPLAAALDYPTPPAENATGLRGWQALADLLLTKSAATLRSRVDRNLGFMPDTPEKDRLVAVLSALPQSVADRLQRVRLLPEPRYDESHWQALAALVRVLQHAAQQLEVVFAESGEMDFTGMSAAALRALGDPQMPTDLGLYLDYRIRHILVDEFQDTNWNQYYLLEKLTAGWTTGDGRTLFLVGDPMQSIYRFREAEVGLFVRVRDGGIGALRLEALRLTRNFRSRAELVDWVNHNVGPAFPAHDEVAHGQVAYAASQAGRDPGGEISTLIGVDRGRAQEAQALCRLIRQTLNETAAQYRIAILVRARSHLDALLPELKHAGIRYRALKLHHLIERPVVQDLIALTRAIWHPADRIHQLAILRAPWCGLSLADLVHLTQNARGHSVESLLADESRLASLSSDGRQRALRVARILARARALWRRRPLRELVEGAWTALGGPWLCIDDADRRDAAKYLQHLTGFEQAGDITDWQAFEDDLARQRAESTSEAAPADPATGQHSDPARVEVLTIHEAKGLEWDMVILPALERTTRRTERQLLHWFSRVRDNREQIMIAPLHAAWETESGGLIDTIRFNEARLEDGERQRLLYVAATRARERLVISGNLRTDPKTGELRVPSQHTLLGDLWPALAATGLPLQTPQAQHSSAGTPPVIDQRLRRIRADWHPPNPAPLSWSPSHPPRQQGAPIPYDWAGSQAKTVGVVTHRLLEFIGRIGIEQLSPDRLDQLKQRIPLLLGAQGMARPHIETAAAAVTTALDRTLADERGRWILSARHAQAACELPLGGVLQGQLIHAVIDRTFIDSGDRWIIDYKTGSHQGGDPDTFLDHEAERYQEQLETYRALFRQMGETSVRCALYFPQLAAWREI